MIVHRNAYVLKKRNAYVWVTYYFNFFPKVSRLTIPLLQINAQQYRCDGEASVQVWKES